MADLRPYGGSSLARLAAMINGDNKTNLVPGVDYALGPPHPFTDQLGRNTQVAFTPLIDTDIKVPQVVKYWRLDLSVLGDLPPGYVKTVDIEAVPFSIHEILPRINDALGIDLIPEEVVDAHYTFQQAAYPLVIKTEASLAWTGVFAFNARFTGPLIPLPDVIPNNVLSGLIWNEQPV